MALYSKILISNIRRMSNVQRSTSLTNVEMLHAVRRHLSNRHPKTYLLWIRVADVYAAHNFVHGRQEHHLLVQMHLPVTPNLGHFLYAVETFPIAVDGQTDHITQIRDLPKYFVATDRSRFYILPRHVDCGDWTHIVNLARSRDSVTLASRILVRTH